MVSLSRVGSTTILATLKTTDPVEFKARHVISTHHDAGDRMVERYIKKCVITRRVLEAGFKAGRIYREAPDCEDDSGWRYGRRGLYVEDAENSASVSLGAALNQADSLVARLDQPIGSVFTRDEVSAELVTHPSEQRLCAARRCVMYLVRA